MDAACEAQRYRTTSGSELVGGEAGTSSLPLAVLYRSHSSANRYSSFGDQVIAREVSNVYATGLPQTTFTGATISLSGTATAHVSAASYLGGSTASDSIVSAFGAELATRTETATTTTLPTTLAGTSGLVKDSKGIERLAPLFFVSPNQVNYLMPTGTAEGLATVTSINGNGVVARGVVNVTNTAPALFTAEATGQGLAAANVQRIRNDGTVSYEPLVRYDAEQKKFVAVPIELRADEQAFLVLYGTGLRRAGEVKANLDGNTVEPLYVGEQGYFIGVDQVNLRLLPGLSGRGTITVTLEADGQLTNPVSLTIK